MTSYVFDSWLEGVIWLAACRSALMGSMRAARPVRPNRIAYYGQPHRAQPRDFAQLPARELQRRRRQVPLTDERQSVCPRFLRAVAVAGAAGGGGAWSMRQPPLDLTAGKWESLI